MTVFGRALSATKAVGQGVSTATSRASEYVLTVAGLGCLSAAAWTVALSLGLVAAGLSCLVLEWRVKER